MQGMIEYYARAVIRHLEGNMTQFEKYKTMAINIYQKQLEDESGIYRLENRIPERQKQLIYRMVS